MKKSRAFGAATVGAILLGFGLLKGRLRRYEINEDSMSPGLEPGDYVIASRLDADPLRGDVVVFPHPNNSAFLMVKRVVGVPTETVQLTNGQVVANDHVIAEPWAQGSLAGEAEWRLSPKQLVVLSDNRSTATADSREFGPIPSLDLWRVGFRYWPPARIGPVR